MNVSLKSLPRPLLLLTAAALCLAAVGAGQRAQEPAPQAPPTPAPEAAYQIVTSYPPGSAAVFPEPISPAAAEKVPAAFIRRAGQEGQEWVVSAALIAPEAGTAAAEGGAAGRPPGEHFVAFTVPQLPRGAYAARYEPAGRAGRPLSMNIFIEPQLHAADGAVQGKAGDLVEVHVGIGATFLAPKGERAPSPVRVGITLESSNPSVVDLAPGQPRLAQTGADGYATWKVRLNKAGSAVLQASSPDFEAAEIFAVVAPAGPGPSAAQRAVDAAERRAEDKEEDVRRARARAELAEAEMLVTWQSGRSRAADIESAERKKAGADERVGREEAEWYQSLGRVRAAETVLATTAAAPNPEDQLLPGDVLLIRGSGFLSKAIRAFERIQFRRDVDYSHAAVYVEVNGQRMIAEMLGGGHTLHPLKAGMEDDNIVDVYRWRNDAEMTPARRQQVVNAVLGFKGKKYATVQLDLLRAAAGLLLPGEPPVPLSVRAWAYDKLSGGERQMICSEMVSWAYHHAGLDPQATGWWPALNGLLDTDERRHDYLTPNTLAVSSDKFRFVVRLKPRS